MVTFTEKKFGVKSEICVGLTCIRIVDDQRLGGDKSGGASTDTVGQRTSVTSAE